MSRTGTGAFIILAAAGAIAAWAWRPMMVPGPLATRVHFADADNLSAVLAGHDIYVSHCASCHGRRLQGQPLWQLADQDSWRRAPAHDWTGHTWLHSDEDLFHITKFGRFAYTPSQSPSAMPAFGAILSDADIVDVIAFIKARWPENLRAAQASLNPGGAGTPVAFTTAAWTFRTLCVPSKPPNR